MKTSEVVATFEKYVISNYMRLPIAIEKGEGSWVWDVEGKRYLDLFPGWGVDGIGHCHPKVVKAIQEQAAKLLHVANNFYIPKQGELAKHISEKSFGGKCFFANSGAEAVEAALKLARLWGAPQGKHEIVTMLDSFHGRTFGSLSATGQEKFHKGIGPILPGFKHVPFNDIDALKAAVGDSTAAIMLEPVQGEGGVNIGDTAYLQDVRKLCDEKGILLILDEVQTAPGRTGKWFGFQRYGIEPDIMTMAKMLGGGVAIGGICAKPEIAEKLVPGTHASTFGGNPIACAAAIATFEAIEEEKLLDNAVMAGDRIRGHFNCFRDKFDFIKDIRVIGCMAALELTKPGAPVVKRCIENGLFINCTHDTVLRALPSMAITAEEIDQGMAILEKALEEES